MRTNILIDKTGTILNPWTNDLILSSPATQEANFSLGSNQVTLAFYTAIKTESNGLKTPDRTTKVMSGLTGTIQFAARPSEDSPYSVEIIPNDTIDISTDCILQWVGITEALDITATAVAGCEYINILVDRW